MHELVQGQVPWDSPSLTPAGRQTLGGLGECCLSGIGQRGTFNAVRCAGRVYHALVSGGCACA